MIPDSEENSFKALFNNYIDGGTIEWIGIRPQTRTPMVELQDTEITPTGIIPKCLLEIYYEKILLQNYFCTQFFVLNVAKATFAGINFRAL